MTIQIAYYVYHTEIYVHAKASNKVQKLMLLVEAIETNAHCFNLLLDQSQPSGPSHY